MLSRSKMLSVATWRVRSVIEPRSPPRSEAQEQRAGDPGVQAAAFCARIPSAIVQEICPNHSGGTRSFRSWESLSSSARWKSCQMFARPSSKELLTGAEFTKRGVARQVQEFCTFHSFASVVRYEHDGERHQGAVDRSARQFCFNRCRSRMRGG